MTEMENSLQAAIDAGKINGAVICATDAQGHFVYNKALGERTLLSGEKRPQKIDDILYLASATKLVATIAALQCVEDGLLTLDGDLSSIIPELSTKQVLTGFSEDGSPQFEPPNHPITLKMLLTHSAGTTYYFMNLLINKWRDQFTDTRSVHRHPIERSFCRRTILLPTRLPPRHELDVRLGPRLGRQNSRASYRRDADIVHSTTHFQPARYQRRSILPGNPGRSTRASRGFESR